MLSWCAVSAASWSLTRASSKLSSVATLDSHCGDEGNEGSDASSARSSDSVAARRCDSVAVSPLPLQPHMSALQDAAHVHELQRARRHVDRECRPHAERRREQRQRRRGEAGGAGQRRARFVKWSSGQVVRRDLLDSRRLFW